MPHLAREVGAVGLPSLVALVELADDLHDGFRKPVQTLRNAGTHRFVVLHDEGVAGHDCRRRWNTTPSRTSRRRQSMHQWPAPDVMEADVAAAALGLTRRALFESLGTLGLRPLRRAPTSCSDGRLWSAQYEPGKT